jgi:hypothetical protein
VTFVSGTPSTCTVAGDQMTLVAEGECLVIANQGGGTSADGVQWAPAEQVSQLFNVLKHGQTVMLQAPDYVLSANVSQVTLAAAADSGLPVTLSVSTPTVCSISGNTLTVLSKGSCAVTATQAGDANYAAATVSAFVAVDPLIVADGILGAGVGSTRSAVTRQNGAVTVNPYSSMIGGWEWCDENADHVGKCFRTVSDDERVFTSALHVPESQLAGWHHDGNVIEIFGPGLSDFNQSGDTTGGLQVTTETTFAMTLGVNRGLYQARKPVLVHLDLGRRNNGCNVTVSTLIWPQAPLSGVGIPLRNFALTNSCGLPNVSTASVGDQIMRLPNWWGTSPSDAAAARQAYDNALADMQPALDSAWELIRSSNIVRVRLLLNDNINIEFKDSAGDPYFASDLSIMGAIKIQ